MPKILYLVTEDWFFVSHFLPTAQAARDSGFQIVVATRVREYGDRLKAEGFSVIAVESRRGSFSPLRSLRDFFQALKIVREARADIVHCIALRPAVIGGVAAKLAGIGALAVRLLIDSKDAHKAESICCRRLRRRRATGFIDDDEIAASRPRESPRQASRAPRLLIWSNVKSRMSPPASQVLYQSTVAASA
jgi:hypothetical protein